MRIKYAVCAGWLVFCAYAFSDAGISVLSVILAFHFALLWLAHWFNRFMRSVCLVQGNLTGRANTLMAWGMEPMILFAGIALAASGMLADIRFAASMQSMNAYVAMVRNGEVDLDFEWHHPSRMLGLYSTTRTEQLEDGTVRFITSSAGLLDRAGFAHKPDGKPMRRGEDSYIRISPGWWLWRESW